MTVYEADEEVYGELSNDVYRRYGGRLWQPGGETGAHTVVVDVGATKADLLKAQKAYRDKIAALEAQAPILVYCTACGKGHLGERLALAKFRKCCTTSTAERKFCRGCRVVLLRTDYVAKYGDGPKGWGTYSKCEQCGTQHRLPVPPPFK
jgi:RNase P subunit RPR2